MSFGELAREYEKKKNTIEAQIREKERIVAELDANIEAKQVEYNDLVAKITKLEEDTKKDLESFKIASEEDNKKQEEIRQEANTQHSLWMTERKRNIGLLSGHERYMGE